MPSPAASGGVYVSVVVAARHDDLRGDSAGRLQTFLDVLLDQMDAASVVAEVRLCQGHSCCRRFPHLTTR